MLRERLDMDHVYTIDCVDVETNKCILTLELGYVPSPRQATTINGDSWWIESVELDASKQRVTLNVVLIAEGYRYCENHPDTVIPCRACMYAEKE